MNVPNFLVICAAMLYLNAYGQTFIYTVCNHSDVSIVTAASAAGCGRICNRVFASNYVERCCGWTTINAHTCSDMTVKNLLISGKRMVYLGPNPYRNDGGWRSCPKGMHCTKDTIGCARCDSDFTLPNGKCSFIFNIYQNNLVR